jgi:hypothetical protein
VRPRRIQDRDPLVPDCEHDHSEPLDEGPAPWEVAPRFPDDPMQDRADDPLFPGGMSAEEVMADAQVTADPLWERYLIDRAEHEAHADEHQWGDLPDDIEPDDHYEESA